MSQSTWDYAVNSQDIHSEYWRMSPFRDLDEEIEPWT